MKTIIVAMIVMCGVAFGIGACVDDRQEVASDQPLAQQSRVVLAELSLDPGPGVQPTCSPVSDPTHCPPDGTGGGSGGNGGGGGDPTTTCDGTLYCCSIQYYNRCDGFACCCFSNGIGCNCHPTTNPDCLPDPGPDYP